MMTIGGARSMLWDDELGSLEVGKKADITMLDVMRPEWQPIYNPIANLVYCAHGGCADTVIVDGKIIMQGGKCLTLNETDLYEEARDRIERELLERLRLRYPVREVYREFLSWAASSARAA